MSSGDHGAGLNQVTVVVVTFNSAHCIEVLGKALARFPHVMVVDNASHDQTREAVRLHMPHAQWIGNERNTGFGAASHQFRHTLDTVGVPTLRGGKRIFDQKEHYFK